MWILCRATVIALLIASGNAAANDEAAQEFQVRVKRWTLLHKVDITLLGLYDTVDVTIGPPQKIHVTQGGLNVGEKMMGQADVTVKGLYGTETTTVHLGRIETLAVTGTTGVILKIVRRDAKEFVDGSGHRYRLEKGDPVFPAEFIGAKGIRSTLTWTLQDNAVRLSVTNRDVGKEGAWIRVSDKPGAKKN